jgi:hypothetical protein
MKLKLRDNEINLTKEEGQKINEALLAGAEFVQVGDEIINSKYIIGVFNSQEPEPQYERLISAPEPKEKDLKRIGELLEQMKMALKQKGIIN